MVSFNDAANWIVYKNPVSQLTIAGAKELAKASVSKSTMTQTSLFLQISTNAFHCLAFQRKKQRHIFISNLATIFVYVWSSCFFSVGFAYKTITRPFDCIQSCNRCCSNIQTIGCQLQFDKNCRFERSCSRLFGRLWAAQHERNPRNQRISSHLRKRQSHSLLSFNRIARYTSHQTTANCNFFSLNIALTHVMVILIFF